MDKATVAKIAEIARIRLTEKETEEIAKESQQILEHFAEIQHIKAEKEMYYVHEAKNPLREDKSTEPKEDAEIRKQFTKSEGKHLAAPKAIK